MSIYIDVLESEVKIKQNLMSILIYHPLMLVLLCRLKGHFTRSQQCDERRMLIEKNFNEEIWKNSRKCAIVVKSLNKEVGALISMTENNNSNPLESAFERMRSFVAGTCSRSLSTKSIQILCVDTVFAGKRRIEVGQPLDPYIAHTLQERIVAIFATEALDQFLVCTTHRGAWRDMPYIFGKQEVTNIQESTNAEKQAQVLAHAGISD